VIERYSRQPMSALWSEEAKYRTWLDVEILVCEAWAKAGKIPKDALKSIQQNAKFDTDKVLEREKITKHDVAAFVSIVQESIGEAGKYLHFGLTSSDVLDTAFAYRLKKSGELILKELDNTLSITRDCALRDKSTIMMGRTHGIHAEPMTMGLKWLLWHDMMKRSKLRLERAIAVISVGKLSGAVGNYAHVPPEVEIYVCEKLGLKPDSVSTQVISRDRMAEYFSAIALLGSCIETIVVELRHLQRTEVGEVREGFTPGQKGSSAMPHKQNPISAENLTGLARLLRSMVIPALENCALWHERDISHSSVERVIGPDANILADYMLGRLNTLLANLVVDADRMKKNMEISRGLVFSQTCLLALINSGCQRDEAYGIIQESAFESTAKNIPFSQALKANPKATKLISHEALDMLFDVSRFTRHQDHLFEKVLNDDLDKKTGSPGR